MTQYFLSVHWAHGYKSFVADTMALVTRKLFLKGSTNQLRSRVIRNIGLTLLERGYNIELIHGCINPNNLEGVLIPQLNLGLICGENLDNLTGGKVIDLDQFRDEEKYLTYGSKVKDILEQKDVAIELAQEELAKFNREYQNSFARKKELEDRQVLFITEKILNALFSKEKGVLYHRIAQALTGVGLVNYYPILLKGITNKVYLNGVSPDNGSGILKIVAREAVIKGLQVEAYFNCLDLGIIELLIIPEMSMAIGAKNITGDFKKIINYVEESKDSDNLLLQDLPVGKVVAYLKKADDLNDQACLLYQEAIDFKGIENLEKQLITEILQG